MNKKLPYLNIGCGYTIHPEWINVDLLPCLPDVQVVDILNGLPFEARSMEVCYHSHVLEHLDSESANFLIKECFRVLKPGGTLRVVVPDLEQITKLYLEQLDAAWNGNVGAADNYDWMMLEMFDQVLRVKSGGRMQEYLEMEQIPNKEFVRSRIGSVMDNYRPKAAALKTNHSAKPVSLKEKILYGLMGSAAFDRFKAAEFRNSGETHLWMYDRFSLKRLLEKFGFSQIAVMQSDQSRIPIFSSYELDKANGEIRKADSLFIEAIKP